MGVAAVLGVLGTIDKVLSNRRVQGIIGTAPVPATCGQDQRLDVLIAELRELNRSIDQLIVLQAEALRFAVEQAGPAPGVMVTMTEPRQAATMEMLPEREAGAKRKR